MFFYARNKPKFIKNNFDDIEVIDGLKIRIYTDNSQYHLNCLNNEDYPQIVLEESNNPITIKSDILKLDRFIHKVVSDYNISNYEYKKVSESKLEDTEEL